RDKCILGSKFQEKKQKTSGKSRKKVGKIAGNRNSGEQFWTFGKKGEKIENLTWSGLSLNS
ncbi:MAG: hypothetical protein PF689_04605, partial [Deltaproteobacteria bacterium]|nr:hypothetical protein [Deltaproteobacteria bacterium]